MTQPVKTIVAGPAPTAAPPTSVAETLRAAKAKIGTSERWCKGGLAKPSKYSESSVNVNDPKAGAWCALGALRFVDGPHEQAAIRILAESIGSGPVSKLFLYSGISKFNDDPGTRHRDVMRAFDRAIKLAEARS